ncbi:MAG: extracellular solute-binding protein [Candidatus Eremiobacteraeota bacterium]|nr:extracellular solute-binding protein [Candidatus Eremiobacteraeota bacterium]
MLLRLFLKIIRPKHEVARSEAKKITMRFHRRLVAPVLILALLGASPSSVNVVYAGSLVTPMERDVGPSFARTCECRYQGEGKGSVALAKMISGGIRNPDVFISADAGVLDGLLHPKSGPALISWYAVFGTARMVLGYSPRSRFAGRFALAAAGRLSLPDLLLTPGLRIGRTDPKLDPKGYRSLFVMQLAALHYHRPALATILEGAQNSGEIFPEEDLLVRLESGDLDVAFLYSTESQSRKLPALELPGEINLGHPAFARQYGLAAVTVDGRTLHGAPIAYALTIPTNAANTTGARAFARYVLSGAGKTALQRSGLLFITPLIVGDRAAATSAFK